MFRSMWQSISGCCSSNQEDADESGSRAQADPVYDAPRNIEDDEITPSRVKRMREEEGDTLSIAGGVDLRNWHTDGTLKHEFGPIKYVAPGPEGQSVPKRFRPLPTHSVEIEMVELKQGEARIVEEMNIRKAEVVVSEINAEG